MREFQLIEKYFKPLAKSCPAAQNLDDDVAKIALAQNEELIISKDVFVEDVHFLLKDGGFKIASKLLRTNLSDLASAGAKPLYYMLGFAKNNSTDEKFLREFTRGLKAIQNEFGINLIGGDTVKSDRLFFSVTIFGSVLKNSAMSRSKAKSGDLIYVSGTIGDAFLGLHCYKKSQKNSKLLQRHFFPTPRINLGQKLIAEKISQCAIDVSDGLIADLEQICRASKLSAEIEINKIPLSLSAQKFLQKNSAIKVEDLISGGDDYELIFSVNRKNRHKVSEIAKRLQLDLTCIGEFKKSSSQKNIVTLFDDKKRKIKIKKTGYEH